MKQAVKPAPVVVDKKAPEPVKQAKESHKVENGIQVRVLLECPRMLGSGLRELFLSGFTRDAHTQTNALKPGCV